MISSDEAKRRDVELMLLRLAMNNGETYGGGGFYKRLDTAGEQSPAVLNKRQGFFWVAFYGDPDGTLRGMASADDTYGIDYMVLGLMGFDPSQHPAGKMTADDQPLIVRPSWIKRLLLRLTGRRFTPQTNSEHAYEHGVRTAAKRQLPFLVVLRTFDTERAGNSDNLELLWPVGTQLLPLVERVQEGLRDGKIVFNY